MNFVFSPFLLYLYHHPEMCMTTCTVFTDHPTSESWSTWELWSANFKFMFDHGRLRDFAIIDIEK